VGLAAVYRRLRLPHRHERRGPAIGGARRHALVWVRCAHRARDFGFGALIGLATAPTLSYYASADPQAVWQAGAATALFIAGFGAAGYATRRDLSALARILFWALIGLIVFGIVTIFVQIPNGAVIYAVLGLVIFAGLTAFDFQRLRRSQDIRTATLLAASIFLDILNVFLLLLSLFSGSTD
jgi:FtsH-binding integral membrane protein